MSRKPDSDGDRTPWGVIIVAGFVIAVVIVIVLWAAEHSFDAMGVLHRTPAWIARYPGAPLGGIATAFCADMVVQLRRTRLIPGDSGVNTLAVWMARWGRSWESATPPSGDDYADVPPPPPINYRAYTDDQLFTDVPAEPAKSTLPWWRALALALGHYTPSPVESTLTEAERAQRARDAYAAGGVAGRHRPPTRRARLGVWWATTAPRDVDARVRSAENSTKKVAVAAVRWRQPTPRVWAAEVIATHEVDVTRSPLGGGQRRLVRGWKANLPDPTAGMFFAAATIPQGAQ
jgi:hypothetical protein